jgi:hypothetical protein
MERHLHYKKKTIKNNKKKETYTLAVAATVGDVGQDRADGVRPGRPLKLDSPAGSNCSGDVGVDSILVADDIGISACGYKSAARFYDDMI